MLYRLALALVLVACTPGSSPSEETIDADGDGLPASRDCDDRDPSKGDTEIPYDGIDNDCDPATPD
ncbi:MAG: hypothetical protein AAF602_10960, partial [Myxococcota bacterium]